MRCSLAAILLAVAPGCAYGEWTDSPTKVAKLPHTQTAVEVGVGVVLSPEERGGVRALEAPICTSVAMADVKQLRTVERGTRVVGNWLLFGGLLGLGAPAGTLAAVGASREKERADPSSYYDAAMGLGIAAGVLTLAGVVLHAVPDHSVESRVETREVVEGPSKCERAKAVAAPNVPIILSLSSAYGNTSMSANMDGDGRIPGWLVRDLEFVSARCGGEIVVTAAPSMPAKPRGAGQRFALKEAVFAVKGSGVDRAARLSAESTDLLGPFASECCGAERRRTDGPRCARECAGYLETLDCHHRLLACRMRASRNESLKDGEALCTSLARECNASLGVTEEMVSACVYRCLQLEECRQP